MTDAVAEVRVWSFASQKHQRREYVRMGKRLRRGRAEASLVGFARLDAEQFCIALVAPSDEIERWVKLLRPNGRSVVMSAVEIDTLVNLRQRRLAEDPGGIRIDYGGEGVLVYGDGSTGPPWL